MHAYMYILDSPGGGGPNFKRILFFSFNTNSVINIQNVQSIFAHLICFLKYYLKWRCHTHKKTVDHILVWKIVEKKRKYYFYKPHKKNVGGGGGGLGKGWRLYNLGGETLYFLKFNGRIFWRERVIDRKWFRHSFEYLLHILYLAWSICFFFIFCFICRKKYREGMH